MHRNKFNMRSALAFLPVLFLHPGLHAQTSLGGPIQAFTYDAPTRSIRAVNGFPGAASFGPALIDNLDFASVAPLQNYGIVLKGGAYVLMSGLGSSTSSLQISGIAANPEAVVWSQNGSVAVLYSRSQSWFQIVSGLPASPMAAAQVDVSSLGPLASIAVDATGANVVVGVTGNSGGIYQAKGAQFMLLAALRNPVSLSFSSVGETVYALDGASNDVIAAVIGNQAVQTFALTGMTNPVAIQAVVDSQNRQVLYIAGGTDRLLRVLDIATQQTLSETALPVVPTTIGQLASASFVVAPRAQSTDPLWLFANTPQPGAYFVPAIQLHPVEHASQIAGRSR